MKLWFARICYVLMSGRVVRLFESEDDSCCIIDYYHSLSEILGWTAFASVVIGFLKFVYN
jgi:hypothetical protein